MPEQNPNLGRRIDDLGLSVRTINALDARGIVYVGQLVEMTERNLWCVKNFGGVSMREVKAALKDLRLDLGAPRSSLLYSDVEDEVRRLKAQRGTLIWHLRHRASAVAQDARNATNAEERAKYQGMRRAYQDAGRLAALPADKLAFLGVD